MWNITIQSEKYGRDLKILSYAFAKHNKRSNEESFTNPIPGHQIYLAARERQNNEFYSRGM